MKKKEQEAEENQKLEKFNETQRLAYQKINKSKSGKRKEDLSNEAIEYNVDGLMKNMQAAVDADRESNKQGRPALKRLIMANEVYSSLRKLVI